MHHRPFPDRQVKVGFDGKSRQRLHQVAEEEVKSEVIDDNSVKDGDRVIVRKKLPEEWVHEDSQHQQVSHHQQKKKPDENICREVTLPDRGAGIFFPLLL
jgi:hypothetical protein